MCLVRIWWIIHIAYEIQFPNPKTSREDNNAEHDAGPAYGLSRKGSRRNLPEFRAGTAALRGPLRDFTQAAAVGQNLGVLFISRLCFGLLTRVQHRPLGGVEQHRVGGRQPHAPPLGERCRHHREELSPVGRGDDPINRPGSRSACAQKGRAVGRRRQCSLDCRRAVRQACLRQYRLHAVACSSLNSGFHWCFRRTVGRR